ncbi:TPA: phage tail protein [Klebsiella variicola]
MTKEEFKWYPNWESEVTPKYNVTVLKFGDDYEQRQSLGLNRVKEEWSLTFQQPHDIGNQIDDFLRARAGQESFYWVNPKGNKIVVVSDEHTVKRYAGYLEITTTFRQVFEG